MVRGGALMHHRGAAFFVAPFPGLWQNATLLRGAGMARLMLRSRMAFTQLRKTFYCFV
jgi:hypothetical protein